jgi:threonine/homoserine/homoserine lactone efflux protein
MDPQILIRGIVIGFSIAAPVGPIGVLCIRRTLAGGFRLGLVSGLGAASADAVYGSMAAFGLSAISEALIRQHDVLRLIGGAFLCILGVRTFLAQPRSEAPSKDYRSLAGALSSTFLLTLANPMTILSFAAVFAGLGLASAGRDVGSAAGIVLGVFLGSAVWWVILSGAVSGLRKQVSPGWLRWVNRGSGAVITGFGVAAIAAAMASTFAG